MVADSYKLSINGHTDNVGNAEKNQKLSEDRAAAVKAYLESKGVDASRLTSAGFGQDQPVADNKTKAGRAKNRRVEFAITFEEVKVETELQHFDSAAYLRHVMKQEKIRRDSLREDSLKQAAIRELQPKQELNRLDQPKQELNQLQPKQ